MAYKFTVCTCKKLNFVLLSPKDSIVNEHSSHNPKLDTIQIPTIGKCTVNDSLFIQKNTMHSKDTEYLPPVIKFMNHVTEVFESEMSLISASLYLVPPGKVNLGYSRGFWS